MYYIIKNYTPAIFLCLSLLYYYFKRGISLSTAYRWIKVGKLLPTCLTVGKHRRFSSLQIEKQFFHKKHNKSICVYSRVSSLGQKEDLIRQEEKLKRYAQNYYKDKEILSLSDIGSGLNYNKPSLKKLINLILNQKIDILIVNHKDRLLRFGSEIISIYVSIMPYKLLLLNSQKKNRLSNKLLKIL